MNPWIITILVAVIAAAAAGFISFMASSKVYFNKGVEHRKTESEALIGSAEKEAENGERSVVKIRKSRTDHRNGESVLLQK